MTYLIDRLAELRRHLDHLSHLRPRVRDLSLHNDVLFSLLPVCQLVIDMAGELSARRGDRFEDYTEAVRNLERDDRFSPELVKQLERLPGFRNVVIHDYVKLDMNRVSRPSTSSSRSRSSSASSTGSRARRTGPVPGDDTAPVT